MLAASCRRLPVAGLSPRRLPPAATSAAAALLRSRPPHRHHSEAPAVQQADGSWSKPVFTPDADTMKAGYRAQGSMTPGASEADTEDAKEALAIVNKTKELGLSAPRGMGVRSQVLTLYRQLLQAAGDKRTEQAIYTPQNEKQTAHLEEQQKLAPQQQQRHLSQPMYEELRASISSQFRDNAKTCSRRDTLRQDYLLRTGVKHLKLLRSPYYKGVTRT
jgi:hypothetical protein